jgi:hypothetical protein
VKITLLLADYAKSDEQGKITAVGLGWKNTPTPIPPHALVVYLDIDWNETNQPHKLTCDLLTADGEEVLVQGPLGSQAAHFEAHVEAGRPPGAIHGAATRAALAIGINAHTPVAPGRYEWRVGVEGFPDQTVSESFQVMAAPAQPGPPQGGQ